MTNSQIDLVFEVSWEVCNKVGGIYTVLSSKSYHLHKKFNDNIVFIGPWFGSCNKQLFTEDPNVLPEIDKNLPSDISVIKGRWNVPGNPIAVLVDFSRIFPHLNHYYGMMWEHFGVDSLHSYGDYGESCAFSIAAAQLIGSVFSHNKTRYKKVIAHFNEWTTGMGLLYLKLNYPKIATVFTTHATSIGRSICGNNKPLYGYLQNYNGDQMAAELNMQSKHSLEKSAANNADCFTAVSEITAKESEQLLEIYPGVVTPNGFEKEISGTEVSRKKQRTKARKRIIDVVSALTGKDYGKDTLILGTSGRNEYKNKGIDVFLDSLSKLREWDFKRQIIALIMVPAWVKEPRADLQAYINGDKRIQLNRPNITHLLNNTDCDVIYNRIRQLNFNNTESDKIDVVYIPCYLDGNDGILNLQYYDMLPALDLTVFPSYYEPWGYTPLESVAFGVPTVTTSLSGFGQWVETSFPDETFSQTGVKVIPRSDFNYYDVVDSIALTIKEFAGKGKKEITTIKEGALKTASAAEWENFIKYYFEAYEIALKNMNKRNKKIKNT